MLIGNRADSDIEDTSYILSRQEAGRRRHGRRHGRSERVSDERYIVIAIATSYSRGTWYDSIACTILLLSPIYKLYNYTRL